MEVWLYSMHDCFCREQVSEIDALVYLLVVISAIVAWSIVLAADSWSRVTEAMIGLLIKAN